MSGSVEVRQTQRPHVCCVYFILFCLWWWLLAFVIVLLIVVVLRFLVPFNTVPVKCFLLFFFFLIYMRIVLSYLFVININYISICNFYWPITFLFHNLDICTLIILLFVIYMPLLCFLFIFMYFLFWCCCFFVFVFYASELYIVLFVLHMP